MRNNLSSRINELKKKNNAIILAHNYQVGAVQDVADFVGDSLDLSRKATTTDASMIVFCGVYFMAEIAKILSPEKTILMPDLAARCPLADMITLEDLRLKKQAHPNAVVVCYVNTSAEIKAASDICCTSANAVKIVNSIPEDKEIIFIPDEWLGNYVAQKTNRKLILHNGYCPTHMAILKENILFLKEKHPKAVVLVHPECNSEVIEIADDVLSTNGMINYVKESDANEFIIGTEIGIIYRLKKENPGKLFYPASLLAECPNMKLTTLEKILWALEDIKYEIQVEQEVLSKAKAAITKMLQISR